MSIRGDLARTVVFLLLASFLGLTTWRLLSGPDLPPQAGYRAVFRDVSDLRAGDDVKVAGVAVGRVDDVAIEPWAGTATVRFSVVTSLPLTSETHAAIRYKNLTGDRYLALTQGVAPAGRAATGTDLTNTARSADNTPDRTAGRGTVLPPGGEIPEARTQPALDLDALFGGFQPLFKALTPEQINKLSGQLIQVLQGEGGTVFELLRDLADYTVALADRTAVIGQVVTNLNTVLGTLAADTPAFDNALTQLQQLVSGLAQQRQQLSSGLAATAELSGRLSHTLAEARPALASTAPQVQRLSALLTTPRNSGKLDTALTELPQAYRAMAGFGSYGNWSNFYLCGLSATLDVGDLPMTTDNRPRCRFPG
ncbi:MAG TPA: MCE family protein [Streptosporangiaceae bacterium]|nr:MCE family protein [Streptosporangiaceae bacterium]